MGLTCFIFRFLRRPLFEVRSQLVVGLGCNGTKNQRKHIDEILRHDQMKLLSICPVQPGEK